MAVTRTRNDAMAPKRKIAIMTSGGDSPGMSAVVRACVRTAIHNGCDAYCIHEGYEGLVSGGDLIRKTEWEDVRGWLSMPGTLIGTARCKAFYERPGRLTAAKNMVLNGIDALIICGGDGSLTGADKFRAEWPSLLDELVSTKKLTRDQVTPFKTLNLVGLVGSIDNDLSGTDATIGAYTALYNICNQVDLIEGTAGSHSRAFVIEVMGRHCGWLAVMAGVAVGADFIFIPEKPCEDDWKEDMTGIVRKNRQLGKRKTIVIIAEGALDKHGAKVTLQMVETHLADPDGLALDTRICILGHPQRGGPPVAYDRILATLQGVEAVKAVLDATPQTITPVIAITENKIVRKPLMEAIHDTKKVATAIKSGDFATAMSLRDAEFAAQYKSFIMTTADQVDQSMRLPERERKRIGFINVGAPAAGMNAAVRAGVAYCLSRGHEPMAIYNGFSGLARHHDDQPLGSVRPFDWIEVDGWASKGGSNLGSNRELPEKSGMALIADAFEKHRFQGFFIVGGFEAFHAACQLRKAAHKHPSLRIPMIVLPCTISNNVPGTEYSLGSDTCLNALVTYCETMKLSASSSRKRVVVIETQGGRSGYVATLAGLAVGAFAVYNPEERLSLSTIDADARLLRDRFSRDKGEYGNGQIILISGKTSRTYSAAMITDIHNEESLGHFESNVGVPAHMQQAIEHLEKAPDTGKGSADVIGISGASVVITPTEKLEAETDWPNRRPKAAFWLDLKTVSNMLSGHP